MYEAHRTLSFTDFLVNEINQDGNVMRVSSLEIPRSEKNENVHENGEAKPGLEAAGPSNDGAKKSTEENSLDEKNEADIEEPWPDRFTSTLQPFLSEIQIEQLKQMYLEGPEPPFVSDSGWTGRKSTEAQVAEGTGESPQGDQIDPTPSTERDRGQRGKRGRDRGGRGRGGGRRNERGRCDDPRKVVTDVRMDFRSSEYADIELVYSQLNQKHQERAFISSSANFSRESWKVKRTQKGIQSMMEESSLSGRNEVKVEMLGEVKVSLSSLHAFLRGYNDEQVTGNSSHVDHIHPTYI